MSSFMIPSFSCRTLISAILCVLTCGIALTGCSSGPYESAPVEGSKARETLTRVMDSWKNGEKPEDLEDEEPSVVVQDMDWKNGHKLVAYELVGQGKEQGANLVATVKLTLQDNAGSQSEKTVVYTVGTAPVLTVFRNMVP